MSPARKSAVLAVLLGAASLGAYYSFRAHGRLGELEALRAEAAGLEAERAELPPAPPPAAEAGLRRAVAADRDGLAELRAALAREEARWAAPDERDDLAVRLSALAHAVGLRVHEEAGAGGRVSAPDGPPTPARLGPHLRAAPFARAVVAWEVRGEFAALWRFLARLEELPWRVVVLRLEVERPDDLDEAYEPPLEIALELAL